ncbi:unnamed protein product [Amoebophrya sp. A120]|nr:unnamed protein product [Amoebophrya sp. A120]|eukprot:GSA120T00018500001.1
MASGASSASAAPSPVEERLVDYLLVVGLQRDGQGTLVTKAAGRRGGSNAQQSLLYKPVVQARFPGKDYTDRPIAPMLPDIPDFVFPSGVPASSAKRKPDLEPYVFSFVLTTPTYDNYYVTCLVAFESEKLPYTSRRRQSLKRWASSSTSGGGTGGDADGSLIELQPEDEQNDQSLQTAENQADSPDALFVPKAICLVTKYPYLQGCRDFLSELLRLATTPSASGGGASKRSTSTSAVALSAGERDQRSSSDHAGRSTTGTTNSEQVAVMQELEQLFQQDGGKQRDFLLTYNLAYLLYEIPLPTVHNNLLSFTKSTQTLFSLGYHLRNYSVLDPASLARDFTFRPLLGCLNVKNLVYLFFLLLTEKKIVLAASKRSLSLLTLISEAVKALLFPFQWHHVYIPTLPRHMWIILECPTPFLVGVHHDSITAIVRACPSDVVVFDLDNDEVAFNAPYAMSNSAMNKQDPEQPADQQAGEQQHEFASSKNMPCVYQDCMPIIVPESFLRFFQAQLRNAALHERSGAGGTAAQNQWNHCHLLNHAATTNAPALSPAEPSSAAQTDRTDGSFRGNSSQDETRVRSKLIATFLEATLRLFWNYSDYLVKSVETTSSGKRPSSAANQTVRFSFDDEKFLEKLRPPHLVSSTDDAQQLRVLIASFLESNAWEHFLTEAVVGTSTRSRILHDLCERYRERQADYDAQSGSSSSRLSDSLRGWIEAMHEPQHTILAAKPAFVHDDNIAAAITGGTGNSSKHLTPPDSKDVNSPRGAAENNAVTSTRTVTPLTSQLACVLPSDSFLSIRSSCHAFLHLNLTGTRQSSGEPATVLSSAVALLEAPPDRESYTRDFHDVAATHKLPTSAAELFCDSMKAYFQKKRLAVGKLSLFQRVMQVLCEDPRPIAQPGPAMAGTGPATSTSPRKSQSSTTPRGSTGRRTRGSMTTGDLSTKDEDSAASAKSPRTNRRTTTRAGAATSVTDPKLDEDCRFRVYSCLSGISEVGELPFWEVLREAARAPLAPAQEPLTIFARGKTITPTFTLSPEASKVPQNAVPSSPKGRRVFVYRSFRQVLARLEDEDLAQLRSDTLKLTAPDLYWVLHLYFSLKIEALGSDGVARVFTIAELCRHYLEQAKLEVIDATFIDVANKPAPFRAADYNTTIPPGGASVVPADGGVFRVADHWDGAGEMHLGSPTTLTYGETVSVSPTSKSAAVGDVALARPKTPGELLAQIRGAASVRRSRSAGQASPRLVSGALASSSSTASSRQGAPAAGQLLPAQDSTGTARGSRTAGARGPAYQMDPAYGTLASVPKPGRRGRPPRPYNAAGAGTTTRGTRAGGRGTRPQHPLVACRLDNVVESPAFGAAGQKPRLKQSERALNQAPVELDPEFAQALSEARTTKNWDLLQPYTKQADEELVEVRFLFDGLRSKRKSHNWYLAHNRNQPFAGSTTEEAARRHMQRSSRSPDVLAGGPPIRKSYAHDGCAFVTGANHSPPRLSAIKERTTTGVEPFGSPGSPRAPGAAAATNKGGGSVRLPRYGRCSYIHGGKEVYTDNFAPVRDDADSQLPSVTVDITHETAPSVRRIRRQSTTATVDIHGTAEAQPGGTELGEFFPEDLQMLVSSSSAMRIAPSTQSGSGLKASSSHDTVSSSAGRPTRGAWERRRDHLSGRRSAARATPPPLETDGGARRSSPTGSLASRGVGAGTSHILQSAGSSSSDWIEPSYWWQGVKQQIQRAQLYQSQYEVDEEIRLSREIEALDQALSGRCNVADVGTSSLG